MFCAECCLSNGHGVINSIYYNGCSPQAIEHKGGYFLEAPVSGSKKPAEDGQLVILAAGKKVKYCNL